MEISSHDSDSLGVDGAKIGVFEEGDEVSLSSLLEGKNSRALEYKLLLELMGDFSDESLEGKLTNEKLSLKK